MKIAVTGANGFIGRHVLAALEKKGIELVVVTRSEAQPDGVSARNCVSLDIYGEESDVFEQLGRPDALIHLAWGGLPNYGSLHHFETELPQQYRFLQRLIKSGLQNLTVTGTCFEYGMMSGSLIETVTQPPSNPYGFAKDALRRQLEFLQEKTPFNLVWTRLFYLYGQGQSKTSLLPQLKHAVEQNEEYFNMSGGEQLRDYLPVEAVADYLVDLTLMKADIGVVNVCSGQPTSVRNLVEGWIREHGWKIKLNLGHFPYPTYEPMAFWGNMSKLQKLLESQ
ncbi:NAD-dependent epimerase/dehydratase family protein [Propionivibrio dicarboxylicus]|uniref:dTDP-6-deoxy-L-talose 4-dehydrogenase (NAD+) n=1 Tax=Propionivibrio dicarboxylicus TaxID=83767 RepID=A0A1G8DYJ3_9RHOO|nr:NAD(P)-dependent oxidoreductase [Propionivibrio dicarboxylicus]SDH62737.1 dTDP-6-deoxy-L-talose 4-dehydrogenase (NAD+) [Propionivibrio dicarboxylicus]